MRVCFLNRFYWPDEPATAQLLADLAEGLAARGHEIRVIASRPHRPGSPWSETHRGAAIRRVRSTHWGRHSLAGRVVDFATFYVGAVWRLWRDVRRGDVVVVLTDPPLIGLYAWPVVRLRGARLVHWVQDIYPEIAMELTPHRWLRIFRPLRNLAWRRAEACVTLGADMAAVLAKAGVAGKRIHLRPNWAPVGLEPPPAAEIAALRRAWGLEGRFVVAYSGNLGRVHDLAPVLDVAAALQDHPEIVFVFVGQGAQRTALEAEARARGLDRLQFHPPQPRARLAVTLAAGDVHLVTLRPGCEPLVFPSKLYGIAAVGRPVLFIGPRDCELARLVAARGLGQAFARDEIAAIAASLLTLAAGAAGAAKPRAAARAFAAETDLAHAVDAWETLLTTQLAPASP